MPRWDEGYGEWTSDISRYGMYMVMGRSQHEFAARAVGANSSVGEGRGAGAQDREVPPPPSQPALQSE